MGLHNFRWVTKLPHRALFFLLIAALVSACIAPSPAGQTDSSSEQGAAVPAASGAPTYATWDEVLAAAKGTTVNWYMWGGSDWINQQVDEKVGGPLKEQFGVTLNRVPLDATSDAVNKVLNEKSAGVTSGGSVDLIWINGENFRTMKDGGLLYGPFSDLLPNRQYVNWDDPALGYDFGVAIDGYETPWASFQWVLEYNSQNVPTPPKTFEELRDWIAANPGRFTYPAPPNHVGSAFVRMLFYWAAGGNDPFLKEFDQAEYDRLAPKVWEYLNEIEPNLWRNGETYPELGPMADLLANGETDFAMEYDANRASSYIKSGQYPATIRTYVLDSGTLANISYVAIPFNAPNPAGALVLANYLLSPEYQIGMADANSLGWGVAIDPAKLSADEQKQLADIPRGEATLASDVLRGAALPEARASWVEPIDKGWEENVLKK
ncbi:MAG: ABC transporter substrate-binding protein [Caldilineaceae bacterium]